MPDYLPYSRREAFEQLARVAAEADPAEFDMGQWLENETGRPGSLATVLADGTAACGTAGCLAGHAVCRSWFRDRGLRLAVYAAAGGVKEWSPVFKDAEPSMRLYDGLAAFFRISLNDAKHLFSPDEYGEPCGEEPLRDARVRIAKFLMMFGSADDVVL